jgi:Chalcone isomerase N-terminal domain
MRSYLILNLKTMNDLPLVERWLLKTHAGETLSMNGPILDRYVSYRSVPAPTGAEAFGYYNWRLTEHWWRENPFRNGNLMDQGTTFSEVWPPNYTNIIGLPTGEKRSAGWQGKPNGAHPPVKVFIPRRPSEDFHGRGLTMDDGTILRWVVAIKYPEGVSREEGDDWYINTHAPEVCKQVGLKRFFSFKVTEPVTSQFVRVSEFWYENADAWTRAIIDEPTSYTPPPWAVHNQYPFLEPFVDMIGTFILEAPTDDFLRGYNGYVFTS